MGFKLEDNVTAGKNFLWTGSGWVSDAELMKPRRTEALHFTLLLALLWSVPCDCRAVSNTPVSGVSICFYLSPVVTFMRRDNHRFFLTGPSFKWGRLSQQSNKHMLSIKGAAVKYCCDDMWRQWHEQRREISKTFLTYYKCNSTLCTRVLHIESFDFLIVRHSGHFPCFHSPAHPLDS